MVTRWSVPAGKLQPSQLKLSTEIKTTRKQDPNSKMTKLYLTVKKILSSAAIKEHNEIHIQYFEVGSAFQEEF